MEFSTPITVVKSTITPSIVGTLRRSSRYPIAGVKITPPTGSATSKKAPILGVIVLFTDRKSVV